VLERLARDRRREIGGVGEIHRRLAAGHGRLLEENLLIRPVVGAPVTSGGAAVLTRNVRASPSSVNAVGSSTSRRYRSIRDNPCSTVSDVATM
jgi:hypothetical protein